MRNAVVIISTLLLAATAVTASAAPKRSERGEADLAKALAGRVEGAPVNCINLREIRSSRIYDGTAIVYEVGRTLYVNRPSGRPSSVVTISR